MREALFTLKIGGESRNSQIYEIVARECGLHEMDKELDKTDNFLMRL
jgi:hypothetical protein